MKSSLTSSNSDMQSKMQDESFVKVRLQTLSKIQNHAFVDKKPSSARNRIVDRTASQQTI